MRTGILLLTGLLATHSVHALTICYDESTFPSAMRIEAGKDGVVAILGGNSWNDQRETVAAARYVDGRWYKAPRQSETKFTVMAPGYRKCPLNIPLPALSAAEAHQLREWAYKPDEFMQYVTACVEEKDYVYFGLGLYQGEGVSGVGGVGRLDKRTNTIELRRPLLLRDSSVTAIAHDGKSLWLGTATEGECSGLIASHGLLRYEWDTQIIEQEAHFPGLIIHDLLFAKGNLWAASDMGVTRGTRDSFGYRWEHWTYAGNDDAPLQRENQFELYNHLARTLSTTPHPAGDSPFNYFIEALARISPRVAVSTLTEALANPSHDKRR